jgi:SAM-dependent methyltransferase
MIYNYQGTMYPDYLRRGNAQRFIAPAALHFCVGVGYDVGAGNHPLPGATPIEVKNGKDGMALPDVKVDYVFSSHCLEHLIDPVRAIEHWKSRIKVGGVLFLYLPHPDMVYWRPQNCRKHLHLFRPGDIAQLLRDLGFTGVMWSERDLAWSFAVLGFNGAVKVMP